jgi:hypothetical protein
MKYVINDQSFDHKSIHLSFKNANNGPAKANMNKLDDPGINEIVFCSILFTFLEYAQYRDLDGYDDNAVIEDNRQLIRLKEEVPNLSSRLADIKQIAICNASSNDKLLSFLLNNAIGAFWQSFHNSSPNLNFFLERFNVNITPSLFLQCILNNVHNELVSFQCSISKAISRKSDNLYRNLRLELAKSPKNPVEIRNIEDAIHILENAKAESICRNHRLWENLNMEKASSAFCSIAKNSKKVADFKVKNSANNPPTDFQNEGDMNNYVTTFYQSLYSNKNGEINLSIEDFLGNEICESEYVLNKKLDAGERDEMSRPISMSEIRESVDAANKNTAPGLDNFSYGFIKKFYEYLKFPMINCFNFWVEKGAVCDNFSISKITLIPKKDNLDLLKNWRPISLLSVFYKIFSGAVANRLKKVVDKICSVSQKAYSNRKNIGEVNVNLMNCFKGAFNNNLSLSLFQADYEKAFDSVATSYILDQALPFFAFPPEFIQIVRTCITGKRGFISNLKNVQLFPIESGFPQGDKASPILFNVAIEPMLIKMEMTNKIKEVTIPMEIIDMTPPVPYQGDNNDITTRNQAQLHGPEPLLAPRTSGYADDQNTIFSPSRQNLREILCVLNNFTRVSRLKINQEKCSVACINPPHGFEDIVRQEGLKYENEFTLLGVKYTTNCREIDLLNENKIREKISGIIKFWSKTFLTLPGKITIVKTYILSQIGYMAPFICFSKEFYLEIEGKIVKFLNSNTKFGKKNALNLLVQGEWEYAGLRIMLVG